MRVRSEEPSQADRTPAVMSGRESSDGAPAGPIGTLFGRFFGRRRTYLVDSAYQIRSAVIAVLGMAFLLVFASALFHLLTMENARILAQRAPVLARTAAGGDLRSILFLVAVGILFVAAVFVIEILETHKTAGVVYKVTRGLRELESGRWGARVALRKNDNFKEMEEAFNASTRSLCERLDQDLRSLQGIETQVRLAGREIETGNASGATVLLRQVAGELQTLREAKRNLLSTPGSARPEPKNPLDKP